jgi:hypothetical protein
MLRTITPVIADGRSRTPALNTRVWTQQMLAAEEAGEVACEVFGGVGGVVEGSHALDGPGGADELQDLVADAVGEDAGAVRTREAEYSTPGNPQVEFLRARMSRTQLIATRSSLSPIGDGKRLCQLDSAGFGGLAPSGGHRGDGTAAESGGPDFDPARR